MSRSVSHQPTIVSALVGCSIVSLTLNELKSELMEFEFDEEVCRQLLASMSRHRLPELSLALKGEQACFHDMLQRFYIDDGRGNGYINNDTLTAVSGNGFGAPRDSLWGAALGRFIIPSKLNTAHVYDQFVEGCLKEFALPPSKRWQRGFDPTMFAQRLSPRHAVVKLVIPALTRAFDNYQACQQNYDATRVMIALELFHALHQRWPATLDELAPEILPAPPRDPLHGGAFGYRLLENDVHGRAYELYSFGIDEKDDAGKMTTSLSSAGFEYSAEDYKALTDRTYCGFDFVFNVPRRPSQLEAAPRDETSDLDADDDSEIETGTETETETD